mmetsp:Transcript_37242/g.81564  ORF Transcript_37242/g.81564 Transcript_37242/m.81564 type:complete len:201 (-) Transcript_37242:629-1231(-)
MIEDDIYDADPGTTQKLPSASIVLTLLADVIRVPNDETELPISRAKSMARSSDWSFIISSTGLVEDKSEPLASIADCLDVSSEGRIPSAFWEDTFFSLFSSPDADLADVPTRNIESVISASFLLPLSIAPLIFALSLSCCSSDCDPDRGLPSDPLSAAPTVFDNAAIPKLVDETMPLDVQEPRLLVWDALSVSVAADLVG